MIPSGTMAAPPSRHCAIANVDPSYGSMGRSIIIRPITVAASKTSLFGKTGVGIWVAVTIATVGTGSGRSVTDAVGDGSGRSVADDASVVVEKAVPVESV
ncbi:MAG: hypothetical protein HQ477_12690 [Chloroflexi bacterium]|nr:hypothetical protein [Chloroflexota bacterium]